MVQYLSLVNGSLAALVTNLFIEFGKLHLEDPYKAKMTVYASLYYNGVLMDDAELPAIPGLTNKESDISKTNIREIQDLFKVDLSKSLEGARFQDFLRLVR